MASLTSSSPTKPSIQPPQLDLPDDDNQRGRKRRRSSAASAAAQIPSTGIRGRGRRRSLSPSREEDPASSTHGKDPLLPSTTPNAPWKDGHDDKRSKRSQKYLLDVVQETKKKRSQSPSRSRSFGQEGDARLRRRQRTHSRSRSHGKENRRGSIFHVEVGKGGKRVPVDKVAEGDGDQDEVAVED